MMRVRVLFVASVLFCLLSALASAQQLAPTPPMGWNSWNSYGATIDEAQFRASAAWVAAHLKAYGYQYVTIDEEWFEPDATAEGSSKAAHRVMDANGRYIPAPERFPSAANGAGFAPLAEYVHSLGLKFGIHVLQGIPKEAVERNLPVAGSAFHAKDAANVAAGCPWNPDNFDLKIGDSGQAYYDSIVRLYAGWGVDLIKIDCIASRPYKGDEVRMFHEAIARSGRPIVLSLSPGEAPLDEAANLRRYAQQWRISDDTWDLWHSDHPYPQGVNDQFPRAARWVAEQAVDASGGHWPDADMLPFGRLGPVPGWGKPRNTALSHDEQQTLMTLWAMMRSPLMYGGDPVSTDEWTLKLLTGRDLLAIDQHSQKNRCAELTGTLALWTAKPADGIGWYAAVFNRGDSPQSLHLGWDRFGIPKGGHVLTRLAVPQQRTAAQENRDELAVELAPHASAVFWVGPGPQQMQRE